MKLSRYLDEDTIARAIVAGLRARVDVQTVVEAGLRGKGDNVHLKWAAANKRTLYTFNVSDFCRLHRDYRDTEHAGIIVVPRQRYKVKQQIRLLLNVLTTKTPEDMRNHLLFL